VNEPVPTEDRLAGLDLQVPEDLADSVEDFVWDLETGYYLRWEGEVRVENGLPLTEAHQDVLDTFITFDEKDDQGRTITVNDRARPSRPWYDVLRRIVEHLLLDSFDTATAYDPVYLKGWTHLCESLEAYGGGLSTPPGKKAHSEAVPLEIQHCLRLQQAFAPLVGLDLLVSEKKIRERVEKFVTELQEAGDTARFLGLTRDRLLTILVMPSKVREIFVEVVSEKLGVTSGHGSIGDR